MRAKVEITFYGAGIPVKYTREVEAELLHADAIFQLLNRDAKGHLLPEPERATGEGVRP